MSTFSPQKATQAAAYLVERAKGEINYLKLIKLLYLAERTNLLRFHASITGDQFYSLKFGPVLSETLNLIKGQSKNQYWSRYFTALPRHVIKLVKSPGFGELSPAELGVLEETWRQYCNFKEFELVDVTHKMCAEWKNPSGSRLPITHDDILRAGGHSDQQIKNLKRDQEAYSRVMDLLK